MSNVFYELFIRLYPFGIRVASPFNQKARLWIKGRERLFERLRSVITPGAPLIWMHCSSLGEFEQGRPVTERLKVLYPQYKLLVTFFSPSGYEVRKNYKGADHIFYLPIDSKENAKTFFDIANPKLVLFVKYEFWHYYLAEAKKRNVPLLLVSAIFRKNQPFFSKYGQFHRNMLLAFTHLFVQNTESVALLNSIGIRENVSVSGDTRFDRVIEIAEGFRSIPNIEAFCGAADVVVAGSTWTEDDKELAHFANTHPKVKFIIAPHNIVKDRLDECLRYYKSSALLSTYESTRSAGVNTLIIDNIGMLSRLYKYATVAYVGGGFGGDGVHNVLEAAVYGKPVVFGPEYEKFNEAIELVDKGGGISVENALELEQNLSDLLSKGAGYQESSQASLSYVYSKKGSTEKIIQVIQEKRLLTN